MVNLSGNKLPVYLFVAGLPIMCGYSIYRALSTCEVEYDKENIYASNLFRIKSVVIPLGEINSVSTKRTILDLQWSGVRTHSLTYNNHTRTKSLDFLVKSDPSSAEKLKDFIRTIEVSGKTKM
jgi:hypothetical protein